MLEIPLAHGYIIFLTSPEQSSQAKRFDEVMLHGTLAWWYTLEIK